jgi:hypothetical protein
MSTAKRASPDDLRPLVCMAILRIGKLNAEFARLLFFQHPR